MQVAGFAIENHFSIILIRPITKRREKQLRNITPDDAQWFGGALVVEPRYADGLIEALLRGEGQ